MNEHFICVQIPELCTKGIIIIIKKKKGSHTARHRNRESSLLGLDLMNMNVIDAQWNVEEVNTARDS